ncbi:MAG: PBP1A family penicillin-binding protein [Deltaproteobacteria bacterium]|nr:MAG: PBP1A family penicillin-binding protein [Deltaproteobacteria bacterium]
MEQLRRLRRAAAVHRGDRRRASIRRRPPRRVSRVDARRGHADRRRAPAVAVLTPAGRARYPARVRRVHIANPVRRARALRLAAVLAAWVAVAAPVAAGLWALAALRELAASLPAVPDLDGWERRAPATSVVVAADGTIAAEIPFRVSDAEAGHRFPVRFDDIPPRMVQAVLAAEDRRFFRHGGVDLRAVVRAAWANYRAGRVVEGASTLTQQVARNLLPRAIGRERSLRRKFREALLALRIERAYDKRRIFEVYVNHVFLGAGSYGIAAAARAYFDKDLADLSLAETALIAGLAQAPGRADPRRDPVAARARRDEVLERMWRAGFVSEADYRAAAAEPIALRRHAVAYGTIAPWHTERARQEVADAWPGDLAIGGLTIETTAQPALAAEAETLARHHAAELARRQRTPPPQVGAVIWDHRTGYVEATVGGLSWADSRFDRATQACRQPGSAFKPLVYAAALERGAITPATPLRDAPIAEWDDRLGVHWKPTNAGRPFRGVALAHDALVASLNAPAVAVLDRVGARAVIDFAHRLGITSDLAPVRPLALGASCVVPLELAGAYAVFARGGRAVEPVFVTRVRRGAHVLVDRADPADPTLRAARRFDRLAATVGRAAPRVVDAGTAYQVTAMLADVVARGTGRAARAVGRPAAGKTGTTNGNTDAWFVGFTARVVAAVWVGHDDPAQALGPRADGARAALPLWVALVGAAERGRPAEPVPGPPPPGLVAARVDPETGLLAPPGSAAGIELYFRPGTEPRELAGAGAGAPPDPTRLGRDF